MMPGKEHGMMLTSLIGLKLRTRRSFLLDLRTNHGRCLDAMRRWAKHLHNVTVARQFVICVPFFVAHQWTPTKLTQIPNAIHWPKNLESKFVTFFNVNLPGTTTFVLVLVILNK